MHAPSPSAHAFRHSYWGALSNSAKLTGNLEAWFIDRDDARVGHALTQAVRDYSAPGPQLSWKFLSPLDVGDDENVQRMVLEERTWIAVVSESSSLVMFLFCACARIPVPGVVGWPMLGLPPPAYSCGAVRVVWCLSLILCFTSIDLRTDALPTATGEGGTFDG